MLDKYTMRFKVLQNLLRRRRELEAGLRLQEIKGNVFFELARRHKDIALFHDYLKALVLRGQFTAAQQHIRKYLSLKRKGLL